jgi:hypothetical protein
MPESFIGYLIYCTHEHRVQRQDYFLEGSRPISLCYRSGEAQPRHQSDISLGDVRLGGHSGTGADRHKTSLFPKDGRYLVPIKMSVQKAENLKKGDRVTVRLEVQ